MHVLGLLASAYTRPLPQPIARRHAAIVVPVVMTLSTKWIGKSCIGGARRIIACSSIVSLGRPRKRRLRDDSTECSRPAAHLTRAPGTNQAIARASARFAVRLPLLAGTGTNQKGHR